jgi:4-hydroxybenzoate polyprenyltransferase
MPSKSVRIDTRSKLRYRGRLILNSLIFLGGHMVRYQRLMRLDRPIGIWLLLWPTLWALWLSADGRPDERVLVIFVLGTVLLRSAGCIINDFADRKIDPLVARTADRPLATGEVSVAEALLLFAGLMLIALGLVVALNPLTLALAIVGAVVTIIYPFMKRLIAAPQLVLGVAFSWGVPMSYAAQTGEVPREAWLLCLISMIWVVIYDTQYAMADREDDLKIGVQSTAILFGDMDRSLIALLQITFFAGLALHGYGLEMGPWYYAGLAAGYGFALRQLFLIHDRQSERCFAAFKNNAWLGGFVFTGIVLDYVFRS